MNYSLTFLFKAFSLLIFVLLTLYLLYIEFKFAESQNSNLISNLSNGKLEKLTFMESTGSQKADKVLFTYLPALATYFGVYLSMSERRAKEGDRTALLESQRALELDKAQLRARDDLSAADKAKYLAQSDRLTNVITIFTNSDLESQNCAKQLSEIHQIEIKQANGDLLTSTESDLLTNKSIIMNSKNYHESAINRALIEIEQINNEISKNSVLCVDFSDLISKLNEENLLVYFNLVFNQLILSSTISIILIMYGDYLITRFNLLINYPKIAQFIQLRKKLQKYYLKFSFVCIFLGVLSQIALNIYILLPKLQLIFTWS